MAGGKVLSGVCAVPDHAPTQAKRGRGRPAGTRAASRGGSVAVLSTASSPSRRKLLRLESEMQTLRKDLSIAKTQAMEFEATSKENSRLHGEAVLKLNAEDMFWRKRYRTVVKSHERLRKAEAAKVDKANADLLQILAEAAIWDEEAATAIADERAAATAAATAKLEAEKDLLEAKAKAKEAAIALEEAASKEVHAEAALSAAKKSEEAVAQSLHDAQLKHVCTCLYRLQPTSLSVMQS